MRGIEQFGARLRQVREARELSREAAAEAAAISVNYLGEVERGEKWPSFEVLARLSSSYLVEIDTLFQAPPDIKSFQGLRAELDRELSRCTLSQLRQALGIVRVLLGEESRQQGL